jgi:hypothetical protein
MKKMSAPASSLRRLLIITAGLACGLGMSVLLIVLLSGLNYSLTAAQDAAFLTASFFLPWLLNLLFKDPKENVIAQVLMVLTSAAAMVLYALETAVNDNGLRLLLRFAFVLHGAAGLGTVSSYVLRLRSQEPHDAA